MAQYDVVGRSTHSYLRSRQANHVFIKRIYVFRLPVDENVGRSELFSMTFRRLPSFKFNALIDKYRYQILIIFLSLPLALVAAAVGVQTSIQKQPPINNIYYITMSILAYNGAAIIGMSGKDCVGIASDNRLGIQYETVSMDFKKVFKMNDKLFVGLAGLATDVQTLDQLLRFRMNLYELREERTMSPQVFTNLLSNMLYEKRFGPYFTEPVIAGLDEKGQPHLATMDLIGAISSAKDFVVAGTCEGNLYGMCETLYKPDMDQETLFETLAQALLASVDRDALSGWGGVVHIITKEGVISRELKGRQD